MKKNSNMLLQIGLFILLVAGVGVGWYLVSPLFIDVSVDEVFPTAEAIQSTAVVAATEAMEKPQETEEVSEDVPMEEPIPTIASVEKVILAQGSFYDVAHHGAGVATIYQLADGARILRFENFEVLNGPELHVYLTSETSVADRAGAALNDGYDLGLLKGNIGNQNYEIPSDLDLSIFNAIVIWCEPFQVPFSAAPLGTP